MWTFIPGAYHLHVQISIVVFTLILLFLAWYSSRLEPCLSRKDKNQLIARRDYIRDVIKPKKLELYNSYLSEIVSGQEMDS